MMESKPTEAMKSDLMLSGMPQAPTQSAKFVTIDRKTLTPNHDTDTFHKIRDVTQDLTKPGRAGSIKWNSFVPEGDQPAPVVFLFAGAKRAPNSMIDMWLDTALTQDIILIAPDTRRAQGFLSDLQPGSMQAILDEIETQRKVDKNRIYLFGHSQGGQIATLLGNSVKGPWKAVATHAGYLQAERITAAAFAPPIRLYLGTRDHIFFLKKAKEAGNRFAQAGHPTELHVIPGHDHWFYKIGPQVAADTWQWFEALHLEAEIAKTASVLAPLKP